MLRSENDKGIRVNVLLCDQDGNAIDVPGLVAIPSDRLVCFENVAVLSERLVESLKAWQRSGGTGSTAYPKRLEELVSELKKLTELWDGPKPAPQTPPLNVTST
jgi:hypothetical protein